MSTRLSVRRRFQPSLKSLPVVGMMMFAMFPFLARAQALPSGGQVVNGNATIGTYGNAMTVVQSSNKAIINWNNFSIADKNSVRFENGKGATLNRVTGTSVSNIDGLLQATGSVYLINKNGIVVGKSGQIDVGGRFVGSTQDISNESFLAGGAQTLAGASEAPIINFGKIGSLGGDVALIAAKVENHGEIKAEKGSVGLLAGYQVILRDQALDSGKFSVVVGGKDTSVTNTGAIKAAEAELRAQGGNVYALAGNTSGVINAQGVSTKDGRVFLSADGGEVDVSGAITARKADGKGGAIEVTAQNVLLDKGAVLDASGTTGGSVLVGGDWQGGADASLKVADHDIAHANAVVMVDGAKIDVSGAQGAGGKAVLWSDNYTNFAGAIDAHGATDGGMIETSSKNVLQTGGTIDARGLSGKAGEWLLDPSDITISGSAATAGGNISGGIFTPTANTSTVSASDINAALNAGTSVTIQTATAATTTGSGDITQAAGGTISKTSGGDASLTLKADRNIVLNDTITSTSGKLNVSLNSRASDDAATGTAVGAVTIGGNISSNGGNILVYGGNAVTGSARATGTAISVGGATTLNAAGGNISLSGTSTANSWGISVGSGGVRTIGAGTVTMNGRSGIYLGGTAISTDAGAVSLTGNSSGMSNMGMYVNGGTTISTGSGAISLSGTTGSGTTGLLMLNTSMLSSSGDITLFGSNGSYSGIEAWNNLTATTGGAGKVSITGEGGGLAYDSANYRQAAAINFGASNTASTTKITSGTGGVLLKGTASNTNNYAITGGNMAAASAVTSAGAIDVQGNAYTYLTSMAFTQSQATNAAVTMTSTNGYVYTGALNLKTSAASVLKGQATVNTGAITLAGNGDLLLDGGAGGTSMGAVSKTADATGASTLTLKSAGGITVGSAITAQDGAGALNVLLNSRATGNTEGLISITNAITTRGGNVYGWGGTGAVGSGYAFSSGANGVNTASGTIDAGGGNVNLMGQTSFASGYGVSTAAIRTKDNGSITLTGYGAANSTNGASINGVLVTDKGDLTVSGTTISGTDKNGMGVYVSPNGAMTTGSGNLTLKGNATYDAALTLYAPLRSTSGNILVQGVGNVYEGILVPYGGQLTATTGGTGSVTIEGTGGGSPYGGYCGPSSCIRVAAAIGFGYSDSAQYTGVLNLAGGTGGVSLKGTAYSTLSIGGNINTAAASITSAGAINIQGNQTVNLAGVPISQSQATTGAVNLTTTGGYLQVGSVSLATSGATLIKAPTLYLSPITTSGSGDITLDASGTNLSGPSITKTSAATGASTLTLKSGGSMSSGTITAQDGAGAFNVMLNSGAYNASAAVQSPININGAITTRGGNLYAWAGNGAPLSGNVYSSSTHGIYVGGAVDAGGGNISMMAQGANQTQGIAGIYLANVLRTQGAGAISLNGYGAVGVGVWSNIFADQGAVTINGQGYFTNASNSASNGYGNGVTMGSGTITTGTGAVSITGTSDYDSGILMNSAVRSTSGNISIKGIGGYFNGIESFGNPVIQTGGTGSVMLEGKGGANLQGQAYGTYGTRVQAAILFGLGDYTSSPQISAGTGGLTIKGTASASTNNQAYSLYGNLGTSASFTSAGAIDISQNNNGIYLQGGSINQTASTGTVKIGSNSGTVNFAGTALNIASNDDTTISTITPGTGANFANNGGRINLGAITLSGSSKVNVSGFEYVYMNGVTKTAAATGASSLTVKAANGLLTGSAITTDAAAGKLDVSLISRSKSSGTSGNGAIYIQNNIGTNGGNIVVTGGTDGTGAITASQEQAINVYSGVTLNAGGGDISLLGTNTYSAGGYNGVLLDANSALRTTNAGKVTINGTSTNAQGVFASTGSAIFTQAGDVQITGKGGSRGLTLATSTLTTGTGAVVLDGTATVGGVGLWDANSTITTGSGNISLKGTGVGDVGTYFSVTAATALTSTSGNISAQGSSNLYAGLQASGGTPTAALTISTGGAGKVTLAGTTAGTAGPNTAIGFGYSGGAQLLNIATGTGGLDMNGTVNGAAVNSLYGNFASGSSITSAGAIDMSRNTKAINLAGLPITQTGATGAVNIISSGGAVTIGAIALATQDASLFKSSAALTTGAITLNGAGDVTLDAVSDLTPAAITKSASSRDSNLTLKSAGNVTVANTITGATGSGKLNLTLNSRSADAASGTVAINAAVAIKGGTILVRGGSATAASLDSVDPTLQAATFNAELARTGTAISLPNASLLDAGTDGNIELRGFSTTGVNIVAGTLAAKGAGNLSLYGLGTTGAGVAMTGGTVSTESGRLHIYGSGQTGTGTQGVTISGTSALVTSSAGRIRVAGSGGAGTAGVSINSGAKVSLTGGTGGLMVNGLGGSAASGGNGVVIDGASVTSSSTGLLTVNGTAGSGNAGNYGVYLNGTGTTNVVERLGAGDILVSGTANNASGYGIFQGTGGSAVVGSGSASGTITFSANKMFLNASGGALLPKTTGTVVFAPLSGGSLTVDTDILAAVNAANAMRYNYGKVQFGNEAAASVTLKAITGRNSFGSNLVLASGGTFKVDDGGATDGLIARNGLVLAGPGTFTQATNITANSLSGAATEVVYNRAGNAIAALGPLTVSGNLGLVTGSALTINSASTVGTGAVQAAGDITIAAGGSITATGNDTVAPLQLVTNGKFVNNGGASALATPNGRWLVWSQDPTQDTLGGLSYGFKQYNAFYNISKALGTGNGVMYTVAPSLSIALTGNANKVYDGTTTAVLNQSNYVVTGLLNSDTATVYSTASYDTKDVGNGKAILADDLAVVTRTGNVRIYGYTVANNSANGNIGNISAKALTASLTGTVSKVYDGSTTATLGAGNYALAGVVDGETITLNNPTTGVYDTKNAGYGKTVTVNGLALSGTGASNYTVNSTASATTGVVTQRAVSTTAAVFDKVYDGTTTASGTFGALSNVVAGDNVAITGGTIAFQDRNVGTDKAITVAGAALTGSDAANYQLSTVGTSSGRITAKTLTLNAVTDTKVYDGTTTSAGAIQSSGLVTGDSVTGTQAFLDKNAGTQSLQVNGWTIVDGNGGNNYVVTRGTAATGVITKKTISATAAVDNKVYDSTLRATGTVSGLTGVVAGDTVGVDATNGSMAFLDKNVGAGKAVTVSGYALNGANAGNYQLDGVVNGSAAITQASLVLTAGTDSKVYDGTTGSNGVVTASGLFGSDSLVSASQAFTNNNAGTRGLQVVANSWTINDGFNGGNYAVTLAAPTAGSITAKALTLSAVADNKVYDGTTASNGAVVASGLVAGDTFSATQAFSSKNAGGRMLQVRNFAITDGNGGANYAVSFGTSVAGLISAKTITATAAIDDKVYDSTLRATGTVNSLTGVVAGDTVGVDGTNGVVAFVDKNVGSGKAVTVSGFTLNGADAGNYRLADVANGVAAITKANLVLTAGTDSKTYDGTTGSTGVVTAAGLLGSDTLTSAAQAFDSKNAGSRGLQVVDQSWTIADGNGGGNYAVTLGAQTAGSIAAKALTLSAVADTKVYDGSTTSAGLVRAAGLVAGDTVDATQAFDTKNAGGRTLQVNGYTIADGNGGANYVVGYGATAAGSIAAKTISATASIDDKVYDATTAATGTVGGLAGVVAGDAVGIDTTNGVIAFADKNAGAGKAVTVSGFTLNGNDAGNYRLADVANGVAAITKASLVLTAGTDSKTYDGTTGSTGTVTAAGLLGTDTLTSAAQAFDSKNAGTRGLQVVDQSWTIADGNSGANYAVTLAAPTAGSIAAKALTLNAVADAKVYDGTTASNGVVRAAGLVAGDSVDATQAFDTKNAGGRTLQVNGYTVADGNGGANYVVAYGSGVAGTITAKTISASASVDDKVYDATTAATGTIGGLTGVVAGDAIGIDATNGVLAFVDKNAGNGKAVTVSGYTLNGADAANYRLSDVANGVAAITKANLVLTAGTDSKTYDGTTGSTGVVTAAGLLGGDTLTSAAQAFDSKNAGTRGLQVVDQSWTIADGNSGANYAVTLAAPTAGSIAAKALTLNAVADTKVYDGSTASAGVVRATGLVAGDTVDATQAFDSKNAGGRTLQVNGYTVADGNGGANYIVGYGATVSGTISAKTISAAASVDDKVYDATTAATGTIGGLTGVVAGDTVGIDATNGVLAFVDKNAGNGKAVTVSGFALNGADAANYRLAGVANGVAAITKASLVLTAGTDSKTYDGTTGSTGVVTAAGLLGGDTLTGAAQAFDSKNAGTRGLQVVDQSWTIADGNSGANYAVTLAAPVAGTIAAKALTLNAVADTKVYDGTTASSGVVRAAGLVAGDTVDATQAFDTKNAGGRTLQVNGYTVADGNGGANYVVALGAGAAGTISAKTISATASINDKVYDATTAATGTIAGLSGVVLTDAVGIDSSEGRIAFVDKNVGNGKALTISGYKLNGADAANYRLADVANGVAAITKASLVLTAGTDSKTYDGTTASTGVVSATGLLGGDTLVNAAQAFDSRNAGTRGLQVVDQSWTIADGNGGGNYAVTLAAPTAGSIAAKALTLSAVADTKVYDGTTASNGVVRAAGLVAGDTVDATQAFDSKNAGGRTLQVNGYAIDDGNGGANYVVGYGAGAAGTIAAKVISADATIVDKVYDATTVATGSIGGLTGLVAGDTVGVDATEGRFTFADKNAGNGKAVTVSGFKLNGADAGNYRLADVANGVAAITKASLVLTAGSDSKTYDGTTGSTGIVSAAGLLGSDSFLGAAQAFDSRNAGSRGLQVVANSWTVNDGNSGGNYAVTLAAPTAGTIAAKALTLTAVGDAKVYDGTTASAGVVHATGLVAGDTVDATQAFDSKNAGGRALQVNSYNVVDGNGGANYVVGYGAGAAGTIAVKTISANAHIDDKVYDATTVATGTVAGLSGVVVGDAVGVDASGGRIAFADKNAGNGKAVALTGFKLSGADASNYQLADLANGVAAITKASLVLTAGTDSKTYDGTTASTGVVTASGLLGGDSFLGASQAFDSKNAGSRGLQVVANSWSVADDNGGNNYAVTLAAPTAGAIAAKALTLTAVDDAKVYDGTTASNGVVRAAGLVAGDTLAATQAFDSKNAGGHSLQVNNWSIADGNGGANYVVRYGAGAAGTIAAKLISANALITDKVYDATLNANGSVSGLNGVVTGDAVAIDGTHGVIAFADKNVGAGKAVTLSGFQLSGADANNYELANLANGVAAITKASLVLTAGSDSKTYDGTTGSTGVVTASGLLGTDRFLGATQAFSSKNAGTRGLQVVTNSWSIDDENGGGNYAVTLAAPTAGNIAAKALTLSAVADTKVYDGTTASNGAVQATGLVAGDTVNAAQVFDGKNAGDRTLQVGSYAVTDGNGGTNYVVSLGGTAAGSITAKTISANALVGDKVYDATLNANGSVGGLSGVVVGDAVAIDGTNGVIAFADKNVGNGKAVTVSGFTLNGADAGNYKLADLANGVANITKANLVLTAGTDSKTYDGTTGSTGVVTASGLLGSDSFLGASQAFESKNAGTRGLQVVANSWNVNDGNNGGNYAVTLAAPTAGSIAAKALTLNAVADTKVYDGTTASSGVVQAAGLVTGDSFNAAQVFDGKNAGNRTLQVANYAVTDGNGGANYVVSLGNAAAGSITAKTISANAVIGDKVYDATSAANGSVTGLNGVVIGDTVGINTANGVIAFADKNVGNGKAVTVSGFTLDGADAGNYQLANLANGVANVTKATLVLTAGTDSKTYDGTTGSTGVVTASGLLGSDRFLGASQAFNSKNAGNRGLQVVNNSWSIDDDNAGGNYAVTLAAPTAGTIAAKALTLNAVADTKVYDGTTASAGAVQASGLVAGDTFNAAQVFDSKNAGNRTLQVGSYTVTDGNGGANYVVSLGNVAAGSIGAKTIAANATIGNKVYDATLNANGSVSGLSGVVAGDLVGIDTSNGSIAFADKNVGNGKAVTVSGFTLNGADAGNYQLATLANGVAAITKANLVLTAGTDSKTYDGTTVSTGTVSASGLLGSDRFLGAGQAFTSKNAGNRGLQVVNNSWSIDDENGGGNYAVTLAAPTAGTIAAKALTLNAVADTKAYDGTTASSGAVQASGLVAGDTVNAAQVFDGKNAGNRTLQVGSYTVADGNGGANYVVSLGNAAAGTISAKTILANVLVSNKVYDATNAANGRVDGLSGIVAGDAVGIDSANGMIAFADKNVGNGKAVTVSGFTLNGADAGNYQLATLANGVAAITKANLVLTAGSDSKTYDGTTGSTGVVTASGLLGSDSFLGATQAFNSKNAGNRGLQVVNNSWSIDDGNNGGNYAITLAAPTAGTIAAKTLTLNAVSDTKVYDRTNASSGVVQVAGLVAGDTVNATQAFSDWNAGDRTLQVNNYSVADGNGGANYVVTLGNAAAGSITAKTVAINASVGNKVYDGTTAVRGTIGGLTGVFAEDAVGIDATIGGLEFADRNAGNGKAIIVSNFGLNGANAGNYVLNTRANGVANITKASLVLTAGTDSKVYDGTTASNGTVTINGLVAGDTATATQAFDSKNAGNRTLKANGWTIEDGNNGGNYAVTVVAANGDITRKQLTGELTGSVSKVYDGTNIAALLGANIDGVVRGDDLTVKATSTTFDNKNAGNNKLVTVTGMTLNGQDAGNYVLLQDHAAAYVGEITARAVSVSTSGAGTKTYDGTTVLSSDQLGTLALTAAQGDATTAALLAADGVALDGSAMTGALIDRNAGTGKSVDLSGFVLTNNALGNYVLASDTVHGVANVGRAQLTLTASGDSKVYDGTTASAGEVVVSGLKAGDSVTATQAFDNFNAGNRNLQVAGYTLADGNDGINYVVSKVDAAGSIAQRDITLVMNDAQKIAGTIDPNFTYTVGGSGLVAGDTVSGVATRDSGEDVGSYAIKQGSLTAGNNYAVTIVPGSLGINAAPVTPVTPVTPTTPVDGGGTTPTTPTTPVDGGSTTPTTPTTPVDGGSTTPTTPTTPVDGGSTTPTTPTTPVDGGSTTPTTPTTPVDGGSTTPTTPATPGNGGSTTPTTPVTPGNGGNTTPTNPGAGSGNGTVSEAVLAEAKAVQERATRQLPGTYTANTMLQPGLVGGLDASTGFGFKGTSRIPGSTETLDDSLNQKLEDVMQAKGVEACAKSGEGSACETATASSMPYPSNRVLSSIARFFRR